MASGFTTRRVVAALLLLPMLALADEGGAILNVSVEGLSDDSPKVYLSVYDNDDDWLGERTVLTAVIDPAAGQRHFELRLPPGSYAFSAYLDVNGNGELDSNFIGIPKEPVALSNNARPRFGPPKFKDARFELGEAGVSQQIQLTDI